MRSFGTEPCLEQQSVDHNQVTNGKRPPDDTHGRQVHHVGQSRGEDELLAEIQERQGLLMTAEPRKVETQVV